MTTDASLVALAGRLFSTGLRRGIGTAARRAWVTSFLVALAAGWVVGASLSTAGATPPARLTGRYIVQVREAADPGDAEDEIGRHGGRVLHRLRQVHMLVVDLPPGAARAAELALRRSARFQFVQPETLHEPSFVPNDPLLPSEWHLSKIQAFAAWDLVTGGSAPIAILDSGVDGAHPDLAGKLVPGWNCYDDNADTSDVYGHGTQVAGSAAAEGDNGLGVAGLALANPIMPIRVTGTNGWASDSAIIRGLTWAADHGARVANLSFAGIHSTPAILSAAQYFMSKGGLVTASAGNYGTDDGSPDTPSVVSVSATAGDDSKASWSSYGRYVDVAAPGVGVYTTVRGGSWGSASGTSFSAPVAAGVIALIFAANPSLTPQQAEAVLEANADDLGATGFDTFYGWGRVNTFRAVSAALATGAPPPDTTAPTASISSPAAGATVSGSVAITAAASDNVGVTEVRFYVDGQMIASDTSSPFSAYWDSMTAGDGPHTLAADAFDAAGNRGSATPVSVTVANAPPPPPADDVPPRASITTPIAGASVSGAATIAVDASDNVGVTEVWFYVDGTLVGKGTAAPFQTTWNSSSVADGPHTLAADAFDAAGNRGTTAPVGLVVSNPVATPSPAVTITAPADGTVVGMKERFNATASDASGIVRIELLVDGVLKSKDSSAPYTFSIATKKWTAGTHTVTARALARSGLSALASITVVKPQSVTSGKKH